jgi:hypothetical protein
VTTHNESSGAEVNEIEMSNADIIKEIHHARRNNVVDIGYIYIYQLVTYRPVLI